MNIGITGSKGAIGSHLVRIFVQSNINFTEFDVGASSDGCYGDITDKESTKDFVSRCDGIIHLGAVSRVRLGEEFPEHLMNVNVQGTENIIHGIIESPKKPWIIFTSSKEIYSPHNSLPIDENACCEPQNKYGHSKLAGEKLIKESGIRHSIIRLSNVYGCNKDHNDRLIPGLITKALRDEPMLINGRDRLFDLVHVDDVIRAILNCVAFLSTSKENAIINIMNGVGIKLIELASIILKEMNGTAKPQFHKHKDIDLESFIGNIGKAKKILGWEPKVTITEGIKSTISIYRRKLSESS